MQIRGTEAADEPALAHMRRSATLAPARPAMSTEQAETWARRAATSQNALGSYLRRGSRRCVFLLAVLLSAGSGSAFDYRRSIEAIAHDIEGLKDSHPQLKNFSVAEHLKADKHQISYGYHTHTPTRRGGWTSAVPNPDEDGIWFYIDFHDPASTLQIHTQPVAIAYCVGAMRLSFLSLEGTKTKSVEGEIWNILKKRGATRCDK